MNALEIFKEMIKETGADPDKFIQDLDNYNQELDKIVNTIKTIEIKED